MPLLGANTLDIRHRVQQASPPTTYALHFEMD